MSMDSDILPLNNSIEKKKRSPWTLIGSAIIVSIALVDPGNLQGKIIKFYIS